VTTGRRRAANVSEQLDLGRPGATVPTRALLGGAHPHGRMCRGGCATVPDDGQQPSFCDRPSRANHMVVDRREKYRRAPHASHATAAKHRAVGAERTARRSSSTVQDLTYMDCGGAAGRFGRPWLACLTITIRSIFRGPGRGPGLAASLGLASTPCAVHARRKHRILIGA